MFAKFRGRTFGIARGFAQADRNADQLRFADAGMIVIDNILVGEHLFVSGQVRNIVDHSVNEIAPLLERFHPGVSGLRGKRGVQNRNQVFCVVGPVAHGGKAGVVYDLLNAQDLAEISPVSLLLRHGQTDPLAIAAFVMVPQRARRGGAWYTLKLLA